MSSINNGCGFPARDAFSVVETTAIDMISVPSDKGGAAGETGRCCGGSEVAGIDIWKLFVSDVY
jgi:hypothetical protein